MQHRPRQAPRHERRSIGTKGRPATCTTDAGILWLPAKAEASHQDPVIPVENYQADPKMGTADNSKIGSHEFRW